MPMISPCIEPGCSKLCMGLFCIDHDAGPRGGVDRLRLVGGRRKRRNHDEPNRPHSRDPRAGPGIAARRCGNREDRHGINSDLPNFDGAARCANFNHGFGFQWLALGSALLAGIDPERLGNRDQARAAVKVLVATAREIDLPTLVEMVDTDDGSLERNGVDPEAFLRHGATVLSAVDEPGPGPKRIGAKASRWRMRLSLSR